MLAIEKGEKFWREFDTPTLVSRLHDKLYCGWGSDQGITSQNLTDCREIVAVLMERQHEDEPPKCEHEYRWKDYCGAQVCVYCGDHKGLARCYCGWNLAPGERLEDDVEY